MPRSPRYINQGVIGPELLYIMCNPSLSSGLGFFPHEKIKVKTKDIHRFRTYAAQRNRFLVCYLNHSATMPYLMYFGGSLETGNGSIQTQITQHHPESIRRDQVLIN